MGSLNLNDTVESSYNCLKNILEIKNVRRVMDLEDFEG
jgi:hypothetical protein